MANLQGVSVLDDKATDLGRTIGQSTEYQTLKRATDALNGDRDAIALLRRMEEIRVQAGRMIERGEQPTQEMEEELDGLLTQVQVNPVYQRAVSAQENFDKLMMRVNDLILDGIKKGATSSIITLG
jgi:cell fate (sporulation/competence/biofilm development) regulator YlbF (YheA/YmcA/DUF963 family)